jgi:uncharacterized membrane protein YebE (DUF533 family)
MSASDLLQRLLSSGLSTLGGDARSPQATDAFGRGMAAGGVAGGALGMLLGSRGGRKMGGKALKVGGVATLGLLAYKAYMQWQSQQAAQATGAATGQAPAGWTPGAANSTVAAPAALAGAPLLQRLPAPAAEDHSRALLRAIVAAAKSDGHLDEHERARVEAEMNRQIEAGGGDAPLRQWLDAELRRPVEPAEVAAGVSSPEAAAEVYLASVLMVDQASFMERAYLDALARELRLAPGLQRELEAQVAAA